MGDHVVGAGWEESGLYPVHQKIETSKVIKQVSQIYEYYS